MGSVIAAYSVAWTILMIYVLSLAARQRKLERQLARLGAQDEPQTHAAGRHGR